MTDSTSLNLNQPDAGSRHAGDMLRLAREAQGLSLDHLAIQIKVAVAKLEALEAGQYDRLGDANFTRALAMTVCRTLRIPHDDVLAALPAARLHSLGKDKPAINEPFKDHNQLPQLFDRGHRVNWQALLSPQWLAPLGILLLAGVIYVMPDDIEWPWGGESVEDVQDVAEQSEALLPAPVTSNVPVLSTLPEPNASAASSATFADLSASAVVTAASAAALAASAPAQVASSVAVPLAPAAMPEVATPAAVPAPLRINVTSDAWLEAIDASGKKIISRLASKGEVLELHGEAPIKLRVGNASGVEITYKGVPVSLGQATRNNTARVELP